MASCYPDFVRKILISKGCAQRGRGRRGPHRGGRGGCLVAKNKRLLHVLCAPVLCQILTRALIISSFYSPIGLVLYCPNFTDKGNRVQVRKLTQRYTYPFICQWRLGLFLSLTIVSNVAMSMGVQIST